MPKKRKAKFTLDLDSIPPASHVIFNLLRFAKVNHDTIINLCSSIPEESKKTQHALVFLKSKSSLSNLNCYALSLVLANDRYCVAQGLVTLKQNRLLNNDNRHAIANAYGDFVSLELAKLRDAALISKASRDLLSKFSHLAASNTAELIIYLQKAQIPDYLQLAEVCFSNTTLVQLSDLIQALRILDQATLLNADNIHFLRAILVKSPTTILPTVAQALVTLAKQQLAMPALRTILLQVNVSFIWELCDIAIRLQQANCFNSDIELALAIACYTTFVEYDLNTIRQPIIQCLETPYFKRLANDEHKVLICSLIIALPQDASKVLNLLQNLQLRGLLTANALLAILELGFKQAAKQTGHEYNMKKLLSLNIDDVQSDKELFSHLNQVHEDSRNTVKLSFTSQYQHHGLLKPPVLRMHTDTVPEPMEIEPTTSACTVM